MTARTMPLNELQRAQLERVRLLNEKTRADLNAPPVRKTWGQILLSYLPAVSAFIAVWGVVWGLIQYRAAQESELMKPWLQAQREIYRETLAIVAEVANAESETAQSNAAEKFWQQYHGKMVLIETKDVVEAMKTFSRCLLTEKCSKDLMNIRTRFLASRMAASMAATAKMTYSEFEANQFHYR